MPAERRRRNYLSLPEVLTWCRVCDVPDSWHEDRQRGEIENRIEKTFLELTRLCGNGCVHAQWRATPDGEGYKLSNAFKPVPPNLWRDGTIIFPWRSQLAIAHVNYIVGGSTFTRFALHDIEVRFLRTDIQREFRPTSKPSRAKPFWPEARKVALAWLEENGYPEPGDGGQAQLEDEIKKFLESKQWSAAESTVREHVRVWIKEFKGRLS